MTATTANDSEKTPEADPPLIKMRFAIHLLASACMAAAFWGFITDENAIHNIEPLHLILHEKALTLNNNSTISYSYICLYLPFVYLFKLMGGPKGSGYFVIRILSSLLAAVSMIFFYRNAEKKMGGTYSAVMLILMSFCPVLFISAAEMLTESFSMCLVFLFLSFWLNDDLYKGLVLLVVASLIACPFTIFLAFPLIFYKLCSAERLKMLADLANTAKIGFFAILIPAVFVDYYFYGEIVITALNYISEIRTPITFDNAAFYIQSGFLNFGLCFPLTLLSLPIFFFHKKVCPGFSKTYSAELIPILVTPLAGFFCLCRFLPAQETRFTFPLFPFFVFSAAMSVHLLQDILNEAIYKSPPIRTIMSNFNLIILFVHFLLGIVRIAGIYFALSAPTNGFMALNGMPYVPELAAQENVRFCMLGTRHFPSNFLFPQNNWTLHLISNPLGNRTESPDFPPNWAKHCHFMAGTDSELVPALESGDWSVFFNSSMSILTRYDYFWFNYFPSFWKGYSDDFLILSSPDFSSVQID